MRLPFVILIILAVALALYFAAAGGGHVQMWKVEAPDQSHPDAWQPPPLAAAMGDALYPFAPHAKFGVDTISLAPNASQLLVAAPPSSSAEKMEVSKFTVTSGGLGVSYNCSGSEAGCPMTSCLCAPNAILTPARIAACPDSFRNANSGVVCNAKASGSIIIYPDSRTVQVFSLGPQSVSAGVK